jgi:hypothetical protein
VGGERLMRAHADERRGRDRATKHRVWRMQSRVFELGVRGLYVDVVLFVGYGKRVMGGLVAGGGSK